MKAQEIELKIKYISISLVVLFFLVACNEIKTGKATYTFTIQVSDDFMQKQREKVETMAGDEESIEEIMNLVNKMNSKRIYSLFFQENKTVFSMDTEWYGQEDPNKTYIDYQTKEVILSTELGTRKEGFYSMKWQITDETKKIGKWDVQKATTNFDGQKIIAWFSKHPTLRITPRDYVGLDGVVVELILEAGAKYTLTNLEFDDSVEVILP